MHSCKDMKQKLCSIVCLLVILSGGISSFRCDRRPFGSSSQALPPDGRFTLSVLGAESTYIPDQVYTVQLRNADDKSHFMSFVISAEGDSKPDGRRRIAQFPGELRPSDFLTTKFSDRCLNSVEQATSNFKSSVEVYWQAPPSGNGCVTLRAMVAENENSWFEDGAPLTVKTCEDMRQPDDAAPQLNLDCQVCDEAKYEVAFTGVWSRNTHPLQYPENDWVPRYSDLVGTSHSADFVLWAPGALATPGLKDLAEYANSTTLEAEIREKIGDGVRTLIKGKGHSYPKLRSSTYAFFRTDKINHLVTTAVALHPSPDWFLGVTRFELCQADNTWLLERELNLYPWDAGTDSGVSYESANIETYPQDAVSRVQLSSYDKNSPFFETEMKDLHPFGKLHIKLVKTYHRDCEESKESGEEVQKEDKEESNTGAEPETPSRYQNPDLDSGGHGREMPVIETDPSSPEDCPMSQWLDWSPCEGDCIDGKVTGYRWRERYHLVDGVAVEKYDPEEKSTVKKEVPSECKEKYEDFERSDCTDYCTENSGISASRRVFKPILPGHPWSSKKRDLPLIRN